MAPKGKTLTLGDVLPKDLKKQFSDNILNIPLHDAILIAKYDVTPSENLSIHAIHTIKNIYNMYEQGIDKDSDSSYWNKQESDNVSYWNKTKGGGG